MDAIRARLGDVQVPKPGLKRILVIDDDVFQLALLKSKLEKHVYHVDVIASPTRALELFMSGEDAPYDAVLIDICMPELNGFQLAKMLRFFDPHLPLIYLTAKDSNHNFFEALRNDCAGYLEKPCSTERLHRMIAAACATKRPS